MNISQSQSYRFEKKTGTNNPLDSVNSVSNLFSSSIDIDNDDDFDLFIGTSNGTVRYYENIGTEEAPNLFEEKTDELNPLNSVDLGGSVLPVFVDIDGDDDLDVFIGGENEIVYYKNIGTISEAVYELQLGHNNPLNGVSHIGSCSYFLSFEDIDMDNDLDVFIGWIATESLSERGVLYYKNTGEVETPSFEQQNGTDNPFNDFDEMYPLFVFIDIDGDNDKDAFIETGDGAFSFYENTTDYVLSLEDEIVKREVPIAIYPNPAAIEISFQGVGQETKVRIFSLDGLEVKRDVINDETETINIQSLMAGIYIVILEWDNEKVVEKLIVKK